MIQLILSTAVCQNFVWYLKDTVEPRLFYKHLCHYIILTNGILKTNTLIFPWSEGYITQYTPQGVYGLIVNENNEVNICLMIVKII